MKKFDSWDDMVWSSVRSGSNDIQNALELSGQFGRKVGEGMVRQIFGALYRRFSLDVPPSDEVEAAIDILLDPVFGSKHWSDVHERVKSSPVLSAIAAYNIAAMVVRINNCSSVDLSETSSKIEEMNRTMKEKSSRLSSLMELARSENEEISEIASDEAKTLAKEVRRIGRILEKNLEELRQAATGEISKATRDSSVDEGMRRIASNIGIVKDSLDAIRDYGVSEMAEEIGDDQKLHVDSRGFSTEKSKESTSLDLEMVKRMSYDIPGSTISSIVKSLGRINESFGTLMRPAKIVGRPGSITGFSYGKAIDKMTPLSVALMDEEIFDVRFATGKLEVYQTSGLDYSKGPIIVAIDESGSMSGDRIIWAKAIALALSRVASSDGRDLIWVQFDTEANFNIFRGGKIPERDVIRLISEFSGGGTNFSAWMNGIMENSSAFPIIKKADLVLITDGECSISDKDIEKWEEWRKRYDMRSMSIYVGSDGYSIPLVLSMIVDRVDRVSSFTSEGGQQAIGRIIGEVTNRRR